MVSYMYLMVAVVNRRIVLITFVNMWNKLIILKFKVPN